MFTHRASQESKEIKNKPLAQGIKIDVATLYAPASLCLFIG